MEDKFKNTPEGLIALLNKIRDLKDELKGISSMMDDTELGLRITSAVEDAREEIRKREEFITNQISIKELTDIIQLN
jgi:hypothetical protein